MSSPQIGIVNFESSAWYPLSCLNSLLNEEACWKLYHYFLVALRHYEQNRTEKRRQQCFLYFISQGWEPTATRQGSTKAPLKLNTILLICSAQKATLCTHPLKSFLTPWHTNVSFKSISTVQNFGFPEWAVSSEHSERGKTTCHMPLQKWERTCFFASVISMLELQIQKNNAKYNWRAPVKKGIKT